MTWVSEICSHTCSSFVSSYNAFRVVDYYVLTNGKTEVSYSVRDGTSEFCTLNR